MCLFCFQDLSIDESGVLKSPTIICEVQCVLWPYESFFNECYCLCIWNIAIQNWEFILVDFNFDEYEVSLLVFFDNFDLEVNFIRYYNGYSSLGLQTICLENFFPAFHFWWLLGTQ